MLLVKDWRGVTRCLDVPRRDDTLATPRLDDDRDEFVTGLLPSHAQRLWEWLADVVHAPADSLVLTSNARVLSPAALESLVLSSSTSSSSSASASSSFSSSLPHAAAGNASAAPVFLHAHLRLLGGKGGFGANLRAGVMRHTTRRTTDFSASRDLHGRRLRHVTAERELREWIASEHNVDPAAVSESFQRINRGLPAVQQDCRFGLDCRYRLTTCRKRHPPDPAVAADAARRRELTQLGGRLTAADGLERDMEEYEDVGAEDGAIIAQHVRSAMAATVSPPSSVASLPSTSSTSSTSSTPVSPSSNSDSISASVAAEAAAAATVAVVTTSPSPSSSPSSSPPPSSTSTSAAAPARGAAAAAAVRAIFDDLAYLDDEEEEEEEAGALAPTNGKLVSRVPS